MTDEQFALNLVRARARLASPVRRPPSAGLALAAAALAAASALGLAASVILGPSVSLRPHAHVITAEESVAP
jgi:hypothetical protein